LANFVSDPREKLQIIERMRMFEDVYWIAMLIYYGIPGVTIFIAMLARLFQASQWLINNSSDNSTKPNYQFLGVILCTLIITVIFYSFISRILEFRAFGLYFWLMAGLVVNACYQLNSNSLGEGTKTNVVGFTAKYTSN
jgi:hypothetical protein